MFKAVTQDVCSRLKDSHGREDIDDGRRGAAFSVTVKDVLDGVLTKSLLTFKVGRKVKRV